MKLGILCNFGPFPSQGGSIGGSEIVIAAISERLTKEYNYEISIYGHNYKTFSKYNGINLFPCQKGNHFLSQINHNDHILVYSDSLWGFDTLLQNIKTVNPGVSVALVGAYHLQSHPKTLKLLKDNIDKFNLITHSSITPDYKWCVDNGLPVKVIPNGIFLQEFRENTINFREKYGIKNKYIILNIANYFYGKGQEILPKISQGLSKIIDDFVILQLSNTSTSYPYDKIFFERTKKQSEGQKIKFMRDLSREDVVAAFNCSDVFVNVSKKEVAPLVILESKAAKLPYVSMPVGNIMEQEGGIPVMFNNVDKKGYVVVDDGIIKHFVVSLYNLLNRDRIREMVIRDGQKNIDKIDWDNIIPLYDEVFNG